MSGPGPGYWGTGGVESGRRRCTSCSSVFFDDGNTLCPTCDVREEEKQQGRQNVPPGVGERVRAMRNKSQAEAAAKFTTTSSGPAPAHPGPWRWSIMRERREGRFWATLHDSGGVVLIGEPLRDEVAEFPDGGVHALIAAAPEMMALLRELEWSGREFDQGFDDGTYACCPSCSGKSPEPQKYGRHTESSGHERDCELAALLARLTKEGA
jgi:hypothetical protein